MFAPKPGDTHRRQALSLTTSQHGMNVQVVADPAGRMLSASPALPGAAHDARAARIHGILDAPAEAGVRCWADKGYQGAGCTVRVPYRGRWERLSPGQRAVNVSHAKIRALGERAMATLETWRLRLSARPGRVITRCYAGGASADARSALGWASGGACRDRSSSRFALIR
ncbi:transposase family protein [Streptomyces atratus]|uniref:transposase family protein n=1 Tax=Streptomyces atratus TaxID=1893 RepID=UPI003F69AE6F